MPNETLAYDLIKESFVHSTILGSEWIIPLILIVVSLLIITRDTEDWKVLALPVAMMWHTTSIRVHIIILIGATIIFTINSVSLSMIGNVVTGVTKTIATVGYGISAATYKVGAIRGKARISQIKQVRSLKKEEKKLPKVTRLDVKGDPTKTTSLYNRAEKKRIIKEARLAEALARRKPTKEDKFLATRLSQQRATEHVKLAGMELRSEILELAKAQNLTFAEAKRIILGRKGRRKL